MTRILKSSVPGEPGMPQPRSNWPRIPRPMRAIRSVRTLRKVDESDGATMPESRNLLQRAGVGQRQQRPRVVRQSTGVEASGRGTTKITTPSATNGGGVRNPFRKGR